MCQSTLNQLRQQIGLDICLKSLFEHLIKFSFKGLKDTHQFDSPNESGKKATPFFELLAKTAVNNKLLNAAYSVVGLILN